MIPEREEYPCYVSTSASKAKRQLATGVIRSAYVLVLHAGAHLGQFLRLAGFGRCTFLLRVLQ